MLLSCYTILVSRHRFIRLVFQHFSLHSPMAPKRKREPEALRTSNKHLTANITTNSSLNGASDNRVSSDTKLPILKAKHSKRKALDDGNNLPDDVDDSVPLTSAISRPPAVNSDYLPLPWKGRLGYVCDCAVPARESC